MLVEETARIALGPQPDPAPIPSQKVDSLDLLARLRRRRRDLCRRASTCRRGRRWSYGAVEESLLEADLLIADVKLELEFSGDLDDNNELAFETNPEDEYDDDDADLLSQEADAHTELLFGPPLRPRPGLT